MSVTFIASAQADNGGLNTVTLTVPAGVTTAHLGILTVATLDQNLGSAATVGGGGWTARDLNSAGANNTTSSIYIWTRLGGVAAGNTITVTLPANSSSTITGAWYDTSGRDIAKVSAPWNNGAADLGTATFNAPGYTGTADVLFVLAHRTNTGSVWGALSPAGPTIDFQGKSASTFGGALFGHYTTASQAFTTTLSASAVSHNLTTLQFALTTAPLASETWTGANGAAWPAQWTAVNNGGTPAATIQSNAGQIVTNAGSYAWIREYLGSMAASANQDVTFQVTVNAAALTESFLLVNLACNNTNLAANGWYPATGYSLRIIPSGAGWDLQRQSGGTQNFTQGAPAMSGGFSWTAGTAVWVRFQVIAGVVRVKFWTGTQASEPVAWAGTWTDPTPLAAGRVSLAPCAGNTTQPIFTFDNLTVTDGSSVVVNPAVSSLVDTFATKDTTKWTWSGTEPSVVGGQLQIVCDAGYGFIKANTPYDLTSSSFLAQLVQRPSVGNGTTEAYLTLTPDTGNTNGLRFYVTGSNILFLKVVGGTTTTLASIPFSATSHAWWRIRESGGTVFFDTSPDAATWTQRASVANPFAVTALYPTFSAGYYGTETSPAPAIFDNVNNPVVPTTTSLRLGANTPSALYLGGSPVSAVYLGTTKVW